MKLIYHGLNHIHFFILHNQVPSWKKLSFAISFLRGEARAWWKVEEEARWYDEEPIYTWKELKAQLSVGRD